MIPTHILTLQKTLYKGEVQSITAPGTEGQFTILPHHLPLLTNIQKGVIVLKSKEHEPQFIEVPDRGIFELADGQATILLA
ncbi:MAG: F0F1 ATP synthase subunit epsilon [Candidatus Spechtbacteria bacterium SB0662_bin_43]|uniref:F0F1 ATP synthase subunit epsilon n=1 Tax=Candidatus Spechtbacteria bacterium SB0662_bin_43 TaxID=2604897 RepID=A0A845D8P1_9BACT|nr:F0F1 ATP synthase subunit epsilon [Candidatus Spechtbacteria bacterium SB0662_bin_43]